MCPFVKPLHIKTARHMARPFINISKVLLALQMCITSGPIPAAFGNPGQTGIPTIRFIRLILRSAGLQPCSARR